MALKKITRADIEKLHRSGVLKKVGTVQLESGEKLAGAKFRDYLAEKAKKYQTVTALTEAIKKETAPSQWRQRKKIAETLQPNITAASAVITQHRQDIFGKVFGRRREERKPLPFYRRAKAGSWNPQTGRYEESDINQRPGMIGSRPKNSSIGLGSRLEQAKGARTSALDSASSALGIGEQQSGSGFRTAGSNMKK